MCPCSVGDQMRSRQSPQQLPPPRVRAPPQRQGGGGRPLARYCRPDRAVGGSAERLQHRVGARVRPGSCYYRRCPCRRWGRRAPAEGGGSAPRPLARGRNDGGGCGRGCVCSGAGCGPCGRANAAPLRLLRARSLRLFPLWLRLLRLLLQLLRLLLLLRFVISWRFGRCLLSCRHLLSCRSRDSCHSRSCRRPLGCRRLLSRRGLLSCRGPLSRRRRLHPPHVPQHRPQLRRPH
jgi:hypothetical protein